MNLQEGVELKAMADLVIQIDKVKMEKKSAMKQYNEQIEELESQLLAMSNEANGTQLNLGLS